MQRYEELRIYVQKNFHIEKKDEKCIDRYFAKTKEKAVSRRGIQPYYQIPT